MLSENAFITKYDEFNSQVASGRVLATIYNANLMSEPKRPCALPVCPSAAMPVSPSCWTSPFRIAATLLREL